MITERRKLTSKMISLRDVRFPFLPLESTQSHFPGESVQGTHFQILHQPLFIYTYLLPVQPALGKCNSRTAVETRNRMHIVRKENGWEKRQKSCFAMKPVEEKITKVSHRRRCRMTWKFEQMSDAIDEASLPSENPGDSRTSCRIWRSADFWATVCRTVRHTLGVLWPNGWMD